MRLSIPIIFLMMVISCSFTNRDVPKGLSGKYSVIGCSMTPGFLEDSSSRYELMSILGKDHFHFDFSETDSMVRIDQKLGSMFFGDSIFKYRLGYKSLTLLNHEKNINIPYWKEGDLIILRITGNGTAHFSITSYHNRKNNENP
ncbi:MAG: hypothetical protein AB3N18_16160 [Allomuricauda sp.]